MASGRIKEIDFLRGIAMLLVIGGHSLWPWQKSLMAFHMPLFFFLSGITLSLKAPKPFWSYLRTRFVRLIVPYFLFEIICLLLTMALCWIKGEDLDLTRAILDRLIGRQSRGEAAHTGFTLRFWFLPAVFWALLMLYPVVRYVRTIPGKALCMAGFFLLGYADYHFLPGVKPEFTDISITAAGFVLAGDIFAGRIIPYLKGKASLRDLLPFAAGVGLLALGNDLNPEPVRFFIKEYGHYGWMMVGGAGGILATVAACKYLYRIPGFGRGMTCEIGRLSLPIFPIHLIVLYGLDHLGITSWVVFFALSTPLSLLIADFLRCYFPVLAGEPRRFPVRSLLHKSLYKLNDIVTRKHPAPKTWQRPDIPAQQSSDMIRALLESPSPCMIARYGSTELYCLSNYLGIRQGWKNAPGFVRGTAEPWWWAPERVENMRDYSGFFPITKKAIERFCEMMLENSRELDLLASWLEKEQNLEGLLAGKPRIFLPYMEPWYAARPWTSALEGKRVLVVHPFAEQIASQYATKRGKLFSNPDILPEFSLRTVKAVQSLGGSNGQGFSSWFEALEWMEKEMDKEDYDIALIGCGAYGFPLAAHAKRSGRKAVHMGGALQLLFGIKGNRWEDPMYGVREWGLPEGLYTKMFNDYWVKPDSSARPANAAQVEGACYW